MLPRTHGRRRDLGGDHVEHEWDTRIHSVVFASWHERVRCLRELAVREIGHAWFDTDRCTLYEVSVAKLHIVQTLDHRRRL